MKRLTLIALCCTSLDLLWSQPAFNDVKIVKGKLFSMEEKSIPVALLNYDEQGYDIIYSNGKYGQRGSTLMNFDLDLVPTEKYLALYPVGGKKYISQRFFTGGDTVIHVFSEKGALRRKFFLQRIDVKRYKLLGQPEEIFEIEHGDKDLDLFYFRSYFDDEKKSLTIVFEEPREKSENKVIHLLRYDLMNGKIGREKFSFKYKNKHLKIYNVILRDSANMLILSKYDEVAGSKNDGYQKYYYSLYSLEKGELEEVYKITNEGKHLRHISMVYLDTADVVTIAGFYSEKNMYNFKGTYYNRIDLVSKKSLVKNFEEFDVSLHTNHFPVERRGKFINRSKKKGIPEHENYMMRNVWPDDNGIILLAEKFYYYNYQFKHGHFIIAKIDENGNIKWSNKITKNNTFGGPYSYASFDLTWIEDSPVLIYNGNSKNKEHQFGMLYNSFESGGAYTVAYGTSISNTTGDFIRNELISTIDLDGYRMLPGLTLYLTAKEFLVFTRNPRSAKQQRIIKVAVN